VKRLTQRERGSAAQPLRVRVAAFFCVLLVGLAGIAQAAHIHGDWLPSSSIQAAVHVGQTSAPGEDGCPLCVAMHSALPVAAFGVLLVGLLLEVNLLLASSHKPQSPWYFAAFSRPPPTPVL
jgi:hypothetical protein